MTKLAPFYSILFIEHMSSLLQTYRILKWEILQYLGCLSRCDFIFQSGLEHIIPVCMCLQVKPNLQWPNMWNLQTSWFDLSIIQSKGHIERVLNFIQHFDFQFYFFWNTNTQHILVTTMLTLLQLSLGAWWNYHKTSVHPIARGNKLSHSLS